jgi:hypothetical protein
MKIFVYSFLLNSVYPHFPHDLRSLWMAIKMPGPHLGHVGFVLSTLLPVTLYASFFDIDAGPFFFAGSFFLAAGAGAAILITPWRLAL